MSSFNALLREELKLRLCDQKDELRHALDGNFVSRRDHLRRLVAVEARISLARKTLGGRSPLPGLLKRFWQRKQFHVYCIWR